MMIETAGHETGITWVMPPRLSPKEFSRQNLVARRDYHLGKRSLIRAEGELRFVSPIGLDLVGKLPVPQVSPRGRLLRTRLADN
jgi:hypothetical protein